MEKEKEGEKKYGVFLTYGSVKFHPWRVNKHFLEKQEEYLLKKDQE